VGTRSEAAGIEEDDGGSGSVSSGMVRARAENGRRKRNRLREAPRRGLYAPAAGSSDAHYVALDASGDHRTHAQRGFQNSIAPDDGRRTLALASGALGHAW